MNWKHIDCGLVAVTLIVVFIWKVFLLDKWEARRKKRIGVSTPSEELAPDGKSYRQTITVTDEAFDRLVSACEASSQPNQDLLDAVDYAREKDFL